MLLLAGLQDGSLGPIDAVLSAEVSLCDNKNTEVKIVERLQNFGQVFHIVCFNKWFTVTLHSSAVYIHFMVF